MTWFKVDDGLHCHPKAMAAGTPALGLWVRCGSYAAQHLTEGFIPRGIAEMYGTKQMAKALVDSGLWREAESGYQMHDWLDRNPTRDDVEAQREAAAERQRRARERARESRRDASVTNAVTHAPVTQLGVTVPPTRPDPTRKSQTPSVSAPRQAATTSTPDVFPISEAMERWAREKHPSVTDLEGQTERFLDHHRGKGSRQADWVATWRTWIRNAEKFAK